MGLLLGSLGSLGAAVGLTLASKVGIKERKKNVSGAHFVPESILGAKREGPGPS